MYTVQIHIVVYLQTGNSNLQMFRLIFTILIITTSAFAGCGYDDENENKKNALDLYNTSKSLYSIKDYSGAYTALDKSFNLIDEDSAKSIEVVQDCVNIQMSAFGSKRTKYKKRDEHDFDRTTLVHNIKKYMPPRPLIVIQFIKKDTKLIENLSKKEKLNVKVTAMNVLKTKENTNRAFQTLLSDFKVSINNKTLKFGTIGSDKQLTKDLTTKLYPNSISVSTKEKYGFQTAQFK